MGDFWDGLRDTVIAGVDGYVTIQTVKNNKVEAVPPTPDPTLYSAWQSGAGSPGSPLLGGGLSPQAMTYLLAGGAALVAFLALRSS